jgi:hypothetical protein
MTQRVLVLAGCDLEAGREAEDVETVSFSVNGRSFEMELCAEHREYYLGTLQSNARTAGARAVIRPAPAGSYRAKLDKRAADKEIRSWANYHGFVVGRTGKIPADAREAYESRDE